MHRTKWSRIMSNTCVGCRYNKDRGVVEIKSPATGYWENSSDDGPLNKILGVKPERVWVQTSEAKVNGTCHTFTCQCPHPATCYDGRTILSAYTQGLRLVKWRHLWHKMVASTTRPRTKFCGREIPYRVGCNRKLSNSVRMKQSKKLLRKSSP